MSERDKLAEAVTATKAMQTAIAEADQRHEHERKRQKEQNVCLLREKLKKIAEEYSPKVRVRIWESDQSFRVDVGGDSRFRRPFGALSISVSDGGFHVGDYLDRVDGAYVPTTGSFSDVEQVANSMRGIAGHYLAAGGVYPYHHAEWGRGLGAVVGALLGVAVWGLCWFFGGVWGLLLGLIPMIGIFKAFQALGTYTLALPIVAFVIYAILYR